jgi:uncharacterized protein (TIGR04552 family)
LITRKYEDLPAVLRELLNRLVPYNYVIPGQSVNRLLPFARILEATPAARALTEDLQQESEINLGESSPNHFSAAGYRVINFVADLPVRVESVLRHVGIKPDAVDLEPRAVIYVLTEFQVMDAHTAVTNEQGDSSHEVYKERQHIEVKARLTRGMKSRPQK